MTQLIVNQTTNKLELVEENLTLEVIDESLSIITVAEQGLPGVSGTSDHGGLTGLSDDDHPQYHNNARGDARYYQKSEVDTALGGKSNVGHSHNDLYFTESEVNGLLATIEDDIVDLQGELTTKQNTITGGASTITTSNLTADRAVISNASGKVAVSAVTSTELGYLAGVTSSVQTQINGKANTSHTHAQSDITNLVSDLAGKASATHTHVIADTTGLQTELNKRLKILGSGTPLLENYTDVFEEALSFDLPANFYSADSNIIAVEGMVSASEDSLHEIQVELFDESANSTILGTFIIDLGIGDSFFGSWKMKIISLPIAGLVLAAPELIGNVNSVTLKYKTDLFFTSDGSPCDLSEVLTCKISIRSPDDANPIQSIYMLAKTEMELA